MKKEVVEFIYACLTCQKSKIEHQKPAGLMQPLEIPEWKWDIILMDFVMGLPSTLRGHDSIWVIVDRLTKLAHFIPTNITYPISKLAWIYIRVIVNCMVFLCVLCQIDIRGLLLISEKLCKRRWDLS